MSHSGNQFMSDNQSGGNQDLYDNPNFHWYRYTLKRSAERLAEAQQENSADLERFSREFQELVSEYKQLVDQFIREVEMKASEAPSVSSGQATSDEGASLRPVEVNETRFEKWSSVTLLQLNPTGAVARKKMSYDFHKDRKDLVMIVAQLSNMLNLAGRRFSMD